MTNDKQAYLVIAHRDDDTFYTLISMLDDENNDIFIHMDKKNASYDEKKIVGLVKKSNIYHTTRTNVTWGGYSLINAELILLKKATETGCYNHYHLLSGEDLPIQTQKDIQQFFICNTGKEFLSFVEEEFKFGERVFYRHFFQEKIGRKRNVWKVIERVSLVIQKIIGLKRNRDVVFQKGAQWFSITDDLARYVLSQEEWIKRTFQYSYCADEIFLQTIVWNSDYINNLFYDKLDDTHKNIMRYIDWKRGYPYTFRHEDLQELIKSDLMFARKFNCDVDDIVIQEIYKYYSVES